MLRPERTASPGAVWCAQPFGKHRGSPGRDREVSAAGDPGCTALRIGYGRHRRTADRPGHPGHLQRRLPATRTGPRDWAGTRSPPAAAFGGWASDSVRHCWTNSAI